MKKLLLTTFIVLGFAVPANAFDLVVEHQSETFVGSNGCVVERTLNIRSNETGRYDITIKPLESTLDNTAGTVQIPMANVFVNNMSEDLPMIAQTETNLYQGVNIENSLPQIATIRVKDYGVVPAGTYMLNFELQATNLDTAEVRVSPFTLMLVIPVTQSVETRTPTAIITLTSENAFKKNESTSNEVAPMVYVNSNTPWELSLNTDNLVATDRNYYIRVVNSSSDMTTLTEKVLLEPAREYILATSTLPANGAYVTVEFSMEGKDGKIIKVGTVDNVLRYIVREVNS